MLAAITIGHILVALIVVLVFGLIIGAIPDDATRKKRLAELRKEIPAALAKAQRAATACLEMQKAAILAEACFSVAGLNNKQWKSSDGPPGKELLAKTKAAAIKTLGDLKRLSVESVKLSPESPGYVNVRTYSLLALAVCQGCDPQLCQGSCEALDVLNKIKLT